MGGADLAMDCEQQFLLPVVGAGSDPNRTLATPQAAHDLCLLSQAGGQVQVELDAAGDLHPLGWGTELDETGGVGLGLGGDDGETAECLSGEGPEPRIARGGALGQPGVGQHHWDGAVLAGRQQVGPDLGLHDQDQTRGHRVQETFHRGPDVIGDIDVADALARTGPGGAPSRLGWWW